MLVIPFPFLKCTGILISSCLTPSLFLFWNYENRMFQNTKLDCLVFSALRNLVSLMGPRMYNSFKCWLDSSGFSNTASSGLRHSWAISSSTPWIWVECEYHVDVHANRWWRPVLNQWRLIIVQQVHVVIGGYECRRAGLLLYPPFLLRWDQRSNSVEVLVPFLLGHFFPKLPRPHPLDPPLAEFESWRTPTMC
jgi:hypothetical protein